MDRTVTNVEPTPQPDDAQAERRDTTVGLPAGQRITPARTLSQPNGSPIGSSSTGQLNPNATPWQPRGNMDAGIPERQPGTGTTQPPPGTSNTTTPRNQQGTSAWTDEQTVIYNLDETPAGIPHETTVHAQEEVDYGNEIQPALYHNSTGIPRTENNWPDRTGDDENRDQTRQGHQPASPEPQRHSYQRHDEEEEPDPGPALQSHATPPPEVQWENTPANDRYRRNTQQYQGEYYPSYWAYPQHEYVTSMAPQQTMVPPMNQMQYPQYQQYPPYVIAGPPANAAPLPTASTNQNQGPLQPVASVAPVQPPLAATAPAPQQAPVYETQTFPTATATVPAAQPPVPPAPAAPPHHGRNSGPREDTLQQYLDDFSDEESMVGGYIGTTPESQAASEELQKMEDEKRNRETLRRAMNNPQEPAFLMYQAAADLRDAQRMAELRDQIGKRERRGQNLSNLRRKRRRISSIMGQGDALADTLRTVRRLPCQTAHLRKRHGRCTRVSDEATKISDGQRSQHDPRGTSQMEPA